MRKMMLVIVIFLTFTGYTLSQNSSAKNIVKEGIFTFEIPSNFIKIRP
jgi:hypothetical protein